MITEELIGRLADLETRNAAREQLVKAGASVVDELLAALAGHLEPEHRKTIMSVLLDLNDSRSAAAFRSSLESDDEEVRAIGAMGLCRIGAADALEACLKTIDDATDRLHNEITPSVTALTKMGFPALKSVLPLLDAEDERTRQHAQKVLEQVTFNELREKLKPPPLSSLAITEWTKLWQDNGSYQWNGPRDQRQESLRRWEGWLTELTKSEA